MGNIIDSIIFQPPKPSRLKESKITWLTTSTGSKIPSFHIEYQDNNKKRKKKYISTKPLTLLYSHANAEDLGYIYPWCKYLSKKLQLDIFAYDYTGYGLSYDQGPPTETQCYADIDAAYNYLRYKLQIPASHIILYGRSLGTGPSCYLASRLSDSAESESLGGLVLHAPFLSVYRIVLESGCTLVGDKFPNIDFFPSIGTPTLLIHGKKDNVIPFNHSLTLHNMLKPDFRVPPLLLEEMGHNNVQIYVREYLMDNLNLYIDEHIRLKLQKHPKRQKEEE